MLSCHQHDYIEIACMHHLNIKLTLNDGSHIIGIAHDTFYNKNREECIMLLIEQQQQPVVLSNLSSMTAITKNPHFTTIDFK
ncbi:transcriptional regulator [Photobacterium kishitanii]|uniref:Transcriptional regulator n=1 Tax=Photobacterium kishitanii TaxID=318456 RepID=A0AAX0YQ75_9GAMM|nr:Rho-binding antiterminator [Photobacterium kishitanii]KJG08530.1 transcriptional regulator [Photobacterium kishitanii]KJG55867.1 transcriptional regulator [Photobacterium kishitanii]KJG58883.1 transcriptional regulator [Photobacterium kishitanii]KJG64020.1 transcriptional regulator [Photobacterium kishitanii]KJG68171.1 transcriptional regulator [Photobacterium kishitanii]